MSGLDHTISGLSGGGMLVLLALALLLGLRHASDPDHLVAVSTLLATKPDRPARRASVLGLSWGLGHATSLLALGLPLVLIHRRAPGWTREGAGILVGIVIMALAARLIRSWRRGGFHAHVHAHDGTVHRHLHQHGREPTHVHAHRVIGSPLQAYGIGVLHGIGGSAAVTVLLVASIDSRGAAVVALVVFALATALSMAMLSLGVGYALARASARPRLQALAPALGALSFAFGAWYVATAIQAAI